MSLTGHTQRRHTGDDHPSWRWNGSVGPQGDALIVELRTAKRVIDRGRLYSRRDQARCRPAQSASPEQTLRFSNSSERLDRFDLQSLQNPTRAIAIDDCASLESEKLPTWSPPPAIHVFVQTLCAKLRWLFTGSDTENDERGDFTKQVVNRHEIELKAASRVLLISATVAGVWATMVPMSGAVVLPGTLVVESSVKKIQHPTGGVVSEIRVHDGAHVNAGTLVARLDETQVQANQQLIANQLDQTRARIARLIGERDGRNEIQLPEQLAKRRGDATIEHLVASEASLLKARAGTRQGQKELHESNIRQFEEQIDGLEAEIKSKSSQLSLIATELTGVQELYGKGLVPLARMTTLQRDAARLDGERAQLVASIAETKSKIGQARLQIVQIDQDFRSEVMKDLREAQDKEAELMEKNVSAKDQLDRVDIRAPTAGIVHQLAIHTIGGVVRSGDVIMEIVPEADDLEIEGRLPPNAIDQVKRGQQAFLRFSAFDRQTTPQVAGTLSYVSADLGHDEQTNASFYTVRIDLPNDERRRLNGLTLVSGMPVEIFLQTGSRTMASYLLKPLTDQFRRMFNEP
jgi:HlyD family secretion protein